MDIYKNFLGFFWNLPGIFGKFSTPLQLYLEVANMGKKSFNLLSSRTSSFDSATTPNVQLHYYRDSVCKEDALPRGGQVLCHSPATALSAEHLKVEFFGHVDGQRE